METFSFNRMQLVIIKELRENWRPLLMMLGVMLGTLIIFAVLCGQASISMRRDNYDPSLDAEIVAFTIMLFVFGAIAASMTFGNMSGKEKSLSTLMTPASQFEKYVARWLMFVPAFIVVYIMFCYVADFVRYIIYVGIVSPEYHPVMLLSLKRWIGDISAESLMLFIQLFMLMQSFFVLGSSVWPRKSLVKSFIAYGLIFVVYFFIGLWASSISSETKPSAGFCHNNVGDDNIVYWCLIPTVAICLLNYGLAYFRFRESEIIERW